MSRSASVVLRNVSKSYGPKVALESISFTLGPHTRMGVVGRNGSGKSTLLRVVAGVDAFDSGTAERHPADATIGYMPQETERSADESVRQYLARRTGVGRADEELSAAADGFATGEPGVSERYEAALEAYLALGAADFDSRVGEVCASIDLSERVLSLPMTALSGGEAARASLAATLLSRFDLLLLDEPTNDLDFAGLERLEQFVIGSENGILIVSHDRAFLERTTNSVLELDLAEHTAAEYRGGWNAFQEARQTARRHAEDRYQQAQTQKQLLTDRARTQRQWADQGVTRQKKNPKDNDKFVRYFANERSENLAAKVRITEKAMERIEQVDKPWEGWELRMQLPEAPRSGDVVARLESALVRRGDFRLGPVTLEISSGERVAIVGPNGSGKSTLLSALLGRADLEAGQSYVGPGVILGELDQARDRFAVGSSLIDTFVDASGLLVSEARSLLAKFDLGAEHAVRTSDSLSPGERTRAVLALLMARQTNCLVLDEPTNHLDIDAIEQLESALAGFNGTVLLVTHDRRLLETMEITRRLHVLDGDVTE